MQIKHKTHLSSTTPIMKKQAESIEELRYMRAENDYLKYMKVLNEKDAVQTTKTLKR